ncbi:MAG: DNA primase [Clostridiales bacterium]|nr:DNA primase [Clostridiales bacterium]
MPLPSSWLDELMAKNDIASVISSYTELRPKGRKLWGLCPFHNEKTPSFSVDAGKQLYYCFGCHAGGTVVQFMMAAERLSYYEAIQKLAERAHMEMPRDVDDAEAKKRRALRERIYNANQYAARWFCEQFLGAEGKAAREYAKMRGLSSEIILRYGIGYAPDSWDSLLKTMEAVGFARQDLIEAGLLVHNRERQSVYDAYRGRIIFPIQDERERVLGFGGRVLTDEKPKYINTGDTPVYNKRNNLYGLHLQRKTDAKNLLMVEGYMDVIGLYQAGVTNAVASLGTALTPRQAALVKKYTNTVYIAYDGDAAGQSATLRGLDILAAEGLSVRVIRFPDKLDPDDYVRRFGKDGFDGLKAAALTLPAFKLESMAGGVDFADENAREQYALTACSYIATLEPATRDRYIAGVAQKTGIAVDALRQQAAVAKPQDAPGPARYSGAFGRRRVVQDTEAYLKAERLLIAAAIRDPAAYVMARAGQAEELLSLPAHRALFETAGEKGFHLSRYIATLDAADAEAVLAVQSLENDIGDAEKAVTDCIERLRDMRRKAEAEELMARLGSENLSAEERMELLAKIGKSRNK